MGIPVEKARDLLREQLKSAPILTPVSEEELPDPDRSHQLLTNHIGTVDGILNKLQRGKHKDGTPLTAEEISKDYSSIRRLVGRIVTDCANIDQFRVTHERNVQEAFVLEGLRERYRADPSAY